MTAIATKPNTTEYEIGEKSFWLIPGSETRAIAKDGTVWNVLKNKRQPVYGSYVKSKKRTSHQFTIHLDIGCSVTMTLQKAIALTFIENPNNYKYAIFTGDDQEDITQFNVDNVQWSNNPGLCTCGIQSCIGFTVENRKTNQVLSFDSAAATARYVNSQVSKQVYANRLQNHDRMVIGHLTISRQVPLNGPLDFAKIKSGHETIIHKGVEYTLVPGYNEIAISKDARVIRVDNLRELKTFTDYTGAATIRVQSALGRGLGIRIARLLALTFIPIPEDIRHHPFPRIKSLFDLNNPVQSLKLEHIWWTTNPNAKVPESIQKSFDWMMKEEHIKAMSIP